MKCDYCGRPAQCVGGDVIYPHRPDLFEKKFWNCTPCGVYVGCHAGGTGKRALGRLANSELRMWKKRVHSVIDPYWRDGQLTRTEVYAKLSALMNIPKEETHVGMFDVERCKLAHEIGQNSLLWALP